MAKIQITTAARKSMDRVLSQQVTPHWDAGAHLACLVYLSELCGSPTEFAKELKANSFLLYASNTKKALVQAGLISDDGASEYSFE